MTDRPMFKAAVAVIVSSCLTVAFINLGLPCWLLVTMGAVLYVMAMVALLSLLEGE